MKNQQRLWAELTHKPATRGGTIVAYGKELNTNEKGTLLNSSTTFKAIRPLNRTLVYYSQSQYTEFNS